LLLVALIGLVLLGLFPPHASASTRLATPVPRTFFGLTSEDALATGTATSDTFASVAALGTGVVREPFRWRRVETSPGRYDFSFYDEFVRSAAGAGLEVLPVLFDPPGFRSSAPAASAGRGTWPPASDAAFAAFAAALVRRYGPTGTLWTKSPEIRALPIRAWQVWNEPNLPVNWPGGPSPGAYAAMLRTVGAAIGASDPRAEIVTAGLPAPSARGMAPERFLAGLYRAGARGTFDTLGAHPYARSVHGMVAILRRMRRVMDRFGDRRAGIRVTELGWATGGPRSRFTVGAARQARLIRDALSGLVRRRRSLRLRGVVYYSWKDAPRWAGARDGWDHHVGLIDGDGQAKPGLGAFRGAVRALTAGPGAAIACADRPRGSACCPRFREP
jgi:hypothetical protein